MIADLRESKKIRGPFLEVPIMKKSILGSVLDLGVSRSPSLGGPWKLPSVNGIWAFSK